MKYTTLAGLIALTFISACTVAPTGPSFTALPGRGKSFDQFRSDDASCRQYADSQLNGVTPGQASGQSALGSAALGTAIGAAAGAAFNGGSGAAVGAGAGLLAGSLFGANAAQASGANVQQRYDGAYAQCMYAAGERIPSSGGQQGAGGYAPAPPPPGYSAPPPGYYAAPPGYYAPPPGYAPPPPGY
jgi:hypothetical protein